MAMADEVIFEKRDRIAILTLNRPDRANTINRELSGLLQSLALQAANDGDVRALIVTGAGRHFCGGADLRSTARQPGATRPVTPPGAGPSLDWVPQAVIAATNRALLGGGW